MKIQYSSFDLLPEDTVYNKILKLCNKNNINIKELASRLGVKYHTICNYKNIVTAYNPVTLHKIASILGYDISYFIDFEMSKIGDRIKYLRIISGYGVSDFAKFIGVHRDTIRTWESNQICPSEKNIVCLAKILGNSLLNF